MARLFRNICFLILLFSFRIGYTFDTINQQETRLNPYLHTLSFDFDHISTDNGLPQSSVTCMIQDRYGFMWFGTYNGLCRYDGLKFDVYLNNQNDPGSLSNNMIWSMLEDEDGNLWVGTWNGGLDKMPVGKNEFVHFRHLQNDSTSISDNIVRCMLRDSKGNFWIGTQSGLNLFDKNKGTFRQIKLNIQDNAKYNDKTILCLQEGDNNQLWIGTDGGLILLNTKTFESVTYRHNPKDKNSLSTGGVASLYVDRNKNLWIGSWGGGLNLFHPSSQTFTHFVNDYYNSNSLSNNVVQSILEDEDGRLWLGTRGGGITVFYPKKNIFLNLSSDPSNTKSLSGNMVYTLFSDSDQIIWVGTDYGGISKYDQHKKAFRSFSQNIHAKGKMPFDLVTAVFEDSQKRLWIGGEAGFAVYDKSRNYFKTYPVVNGDGLFKSGVVRTIAEDKNGCFWIGSDGGGVEYLNPKTGKAISYKFDSENPNSISQNYIYSIVIDQSGIIWIATQNNGLCSFNEQTKKFTRYMHDKNNPESLPSDALKILLVDSKNNLWIGTSSAGLVKFDRDNSTFKSYRYNKNNSNSISEDYVISLWEDKLGNIWVGTMNEGINKFVPTENKFVRYTTKQGLSSNRVFGILSDDKNNIWVSTNKGLNFLNTKTGNISDYYISDGLATDEFQIKSFCRSYTGELLFGGKKNLVIFNPEEIRTREGKPRLAFTGLRLFNKIVPIGKMSDGRTILNKAIHETNQIKLSYKDFVLIIEFAVLHYASPNENSYAYKMEGFDKEWNYVGNNHFATYTNLPPGQYVFKVIGSNCDDIWNTEGISLRITITPPFWKTWWFRIFLVVTLISIILLVLSIRTARIKRINKVLEQLVAERTSEIMEKNQMLVNKTEQLNHINQLLTERQTQIEEQSEELSHQKEALLTSKKHLESTNMALNESNAAKDKLFSIIAHDLRSPFNSLLGMTELLNINIDVWDKEKIKHFIQLVNHSADQAYGLLDNLLVWARRQQHKIVFCPGIVSIESLIGKCVRLFIDSANSKEITLDYNPEKPFIDIIADGMMLETVVRNLLSNAIKFTPRKGSIKITCGRENSHIKVSIADSGEGIPMESQHQIFNLNSYTTRGTEDEKGSGLGLIICKDFIEQHNGQIWFKSVQNIGTTFTFTLPLTN